jgi:hypothetical protein
MAGVLANFGSIHNNHRGPLGQLLIQMEHPVLPR